MTSAAVLLFINVLLSQLGENDLSELPDEGTSKLMISVHCYRQTHF